jgi:uncharacterized membrane protein
VSLSRRLSLEPTTTTWRHYARVSKPWIWGYALLWGLTFLTGEPRGIADIELLTLIVGPSVLLVRSSYWIQTWRGRIAYVVATRGRSRVGLSPHRSGATLAGLVVHRTLAALVDQLRLLRCRLVGRALDVTALHARHLRWERFGRSAELLRPLQPARGDGLRRRAGARRDVRVPRQVTRRGWKGENRDYVLYFVILVVGLFATWGSYTPLGHLFRHIPLYGNTRLQSRNVILVDFAMTVLLGWWFHRLETRRTAEAGLEGRVKWLTLAPAFAVIAFCVGLFLWGAHIVSYLGVFPQQDRPRPKDMHLSYGLHLVIALVAVLALLRWRQSKNLMKILSGVLVADVLVFLLLSATALFGGSGPTEPSAANAMAIFGTNGRTALVDQGGAHQKEFQALGVPNMNVFTKLPSVQGYGSLISTNYDNSTGTHPQSAVDPCRLADGTFAQLRLSAIAVSFAAVESQRDGAGSARAELSQCTAFGDDASLLRSVAPRRVAEYSRSWWSPVSSGSST